LKQRKKCPSQCGNRKSKAKGKKGNAPEKRINEEAMITRGRRVKERDFNITQSRPAESLLKETKKTARERLGF